MRYKLQSCLLFLIAPAPTKLVGAATDISAEIRNKGEEHETRDNQKMQRAFLPVIALTTNVPLAGVNCRISTLLIS